MLKYAYNRQSTRQRRDSEGTAAEVSVDGVDVTVDVGMATAVGDGCDDSLPTRALAR
jgi:hypothetical protein